MCRLLHRSWVSLAIPLLWLTACATPSVETAQGAPAPAVYASTHIQNDLVQVIWLEIPQPLASGQQTVRLFMADTRQPEPVIPNTVDLPCTLSSPEEFVEIGPITIPFEIEADGQFTGRYNWSTCPPCQECYMNINYAIIMTGSIQHDTVSMDLAIIHSGNLKPMDFLKVELRRAKPGSKEPHIQCNGQVKCRKLYFSSR